MHSHVHIPLTSSEGLGQRRIPKGAKDGEIARADKPADVDMRLRRHNESAHKVTSPCLLEKADPAMNGNAGAPQQAESRSDRRAVSPPRGEHIGKGPTLRGERREGSTDMSRQQRPSRTHRRGVTGPGAATPRRRKNGE